MNEQYLKKIEQSMKNKILLPTIVHALRNRWPLWWIRNKELISLQLEDRAYRKLKKKYKYVIDRATENYFLEGKSSKIVWVCWLQGMDNAPLLVRRCYESLVSNISDYDIKVITEKNMFNYIEIPSYITDKWRRGIISSAHFSDVIRTNLLVKYGGIWVDSTVLCTSNNLPEYITDAPMFVYRTIMRGVNTVSASNWLISSQANNPILILMKDLLYEYWKNENVVEHYYLFHLFFTMAIEKYHDIWDNIPRYNNINPHILSGELNSKFSQDRYEEIKHMSAFHKLNYKLNYIDKEDTFYNYVIVKGLF
ncbi:Capsular polysaccharide synthesis family protein [Clostridium bornimense]|uniref:Capsular polysaccharide synthesis family protein n=1 Tax=Clostridium bornimense TaxID=1216932 RepID=W6RX20_9CLOT|nr:capsular polysaccharide synthesis protein [Clostridium bornimense]CDM69226.1 Capsular polysaccharide synthesis family protein [Clostridium bornimense]